jgi:hypothetical protein
MLMQVNFYDMPSRMLCGEVKQVTIEFKNNGHCGLHSLYIATTNPELLTFGSGQSSANRTNVYQTLSSQESSKANLNQEYHVCAIDSSFVQAVPMPEGRLEAGGTACLPLWLRGPVIGGEHRIHLLFYYESEDTNIKTR